MPADNGYREPSSHRLYVSPRSGQTRRTIAERINWAPYQAEMGRWQQAWQAAMAAGPLVINSRGEQQAAFDWSRHLLDEEPK